MRDLLVDCFGALHEKAAQLRAQRWQLGLPKSCLAPAIVARHCSFALPLSGRGGGSLKSKLARSHWAASITSLRDPRIPFLQRHIFEEDKVDM